MNYSKELIDKIKKALPDHTELHNALDSGSVVSGKYLLEETNRIRNITHEWIMFYKDNLKDTL